MKTYKFEIIIEQGSDEFWEDITANGKSGCDELLHEIKDQLASFPEATVKLVEFKDK